MALETEPVLYTGLVSLTSLEPSIAVVGTDWDVLDCTFFEVPVD